MKNILKLTTKDFYTGLAPGYYIDRGGLWGEAKGINPFVNVESESINAGLLQTCATPTDITNSITGTPIAYVTDVQNDKMWYIASSLDATNSGGIASLPLSTLASPTSEYGSLYGLGSGITLFQPSNVGAATTRHLYYFNVNSGATQSRMGRIDIDAGTPTNTQDYVTALNITAGDPQTYLNRPVQNFKDGFYYGHVNTIGSIRDDQAGDVISTKNDLDLPADKLITALSEDGTYLAIAATSNYELDNNYYTDTRVYFWDTNQSSWTREWAIPDKYIYGMKRVGDVIYALGANTLWAFNFQTRPFRVRQLDEPQLPGLGDTAYNKAVSALGNAVLFGGGSNQELHLYGEPIIGAGIGNTLHTPFSSSTDEQVTMVASDVKNNFVVYGTADSLYKVSTASGGATGQVAKSVYIPLDEPQHIREFEIIFGEPIDSDDKLVVSVVDEDWLSDRETWATSTSYLVGDLVFNDGIAFKCISNHTSGATDEPGVGANTDTYWESYHFATVDGSQSNHLDKKRVVLRGSVQNVSNLMFTLGFEGGNPKIKTILINGSNYGGE